MGRWGDGEMGRWGDGEMGRWGDGEMGNKINSLLVASCWLQFRQNHKSNMIQR